ncbi:MAG TPA: phosphate ABC transporter ATP-binding protein PstB [Herpetosiphonaceae bacterium]
MAVVEEALPAAETAQSSLEIKKLNAYYGPKLAVRDVSMRIQPREITALIGPSGCGKSTFLRCLNRMHETVLGARAEGTILLDGQDIYAADIDPTLVRRRIGMVFQQPTPLRTRSVYENVAIGLRLGGISDKKTIEATVERSLRQAALWDEVKDKLNQSGLALSGGQQQRLCIARAIAIEPEVLLMDEPCSALDPIATFRIEELMVELKQYYTIVIVTHNMQQAARVSDRTGVFMVERQDAKPVGELVEFGATNQIFTAPTDRRTEEYITGRIG